MEMVSLESEYKRMTAEIKELQELLGEVWKEVGGAEDWHDEHCATILFPRGDCDCSRPQRIQRYEYLKSRVQHKMGILCSS